MSSEHIPSDPFMLLSFLNMKLRDRYASLAELCEDMELDETQLSQTLDAAGYHYQPEHNRFI